MSWFFAARLAIAAVLMGAFVLPDAAASFSTPLIYLESSRPSRDLELYWVWHDPTGQAGIDAVANGQGQFTQASGGNSHALGPGTALWLKLRLRRDASVTPQWLLAFPTPALDRVTVFTRDESGHWRSDSAGDQVAISRWPEAGRYPVFGLQVPRQQAMEVYVRVQHGTSLSLPVRVVTATDHEQRSKLEYLGLGIVLGGLILLVAGSAWQAWALRDPRHGWYAVFGLLAMLSVAAYTGVAGHLLWGDATYWADAAPGCLALLSASLTMRIMGQLAATNTRRKLLPRSIHAVCWLGAILAAVFPFLADRRHGMALLGVYLMVVAGLSLAGAVITWRRGDPVGRWMTFGAAPLTLSVLAALGRLFGLVEGAWMTEYAVVAAMAWNLPMLKGALNSRLYERRSTQLRQQALASHDPLTGLPKLTPFRARVRKVLGRYERTGEPAALVVVSLANLGAIKATRGAEAAEECLLRSVIKIQKLVRDVDAIGRVGDTCFAIVLEGVNARARVSEFASHLIASGLMADPEHPRDPLLQFHVAAALLTQMPAPTVTLIEDLMQLLASMSPRTRRPVRYLHPDGPDNRSSQAGDLPKTPQALQVDRFPEII